MASENLSIDITANAKEAEQTISGLTAEVEKLEGTTATVELGADDQATAILEGATESVETLDGAEATVAVGADDGASGTLGEVQGATDALNGADATVAVDAEDAASGTLDEVQGEVEGLDGAAATVAVDAEDEATDTLDDVREAVDDLDQAGADIPVGVDDQATDALGNIGTAAGTLVGHLGALPAPIGAASGLLSELGTGGAVALGAVSAGTLGIGAAITSSLAAFQELGIAVQDFVTVTGTSFEDASRFIEVAGDLGVSADGIESAIARMNKTAEMTPGKFDDIGAAIVRSADGSLNAKETFIGIITSLNGIDDAGKRAEAGSAIFGKGWLALAPLIGQSADELKDRFDSVSDSKLFTEDKSNKALALRDAFDSVNDAVQDLELAFAEALLPAIEAIAPPLAATVTALKPFVTVIGSIIGSLGGLIENFSNLGSSVEAGNVALQEAEPFLKRFGYSVQGLEKYAESLGVSWQDAAQIFRDSNGDFVVAAEGIRSLGIAQSEGAARTAQSNRLTAEAEAYLKAHAAAAAESTAAMYANAVASATYAGSLEQATNNAQYVAEAIAGVNTKLEESASAYDAAAAAAKAMSDQLSGQVDAMSAAVDAQERSNDSLIKFATVAGDANASGKDVADAAWEMSKSAAANAEAQDKANGMTTTAVGKLDAQNASLLAAAASSEKGRAATVDYIAELNKIPPDKKTEILALLDQGKVDEARVALDEASVARQVALNADANTAQADIDLDHAAADRDAKITADANLAGADAEINAFTRRTRTFVLTPVVGRFAKGGTVGREGGFAGEAGAEFIQQPGEPVRLITGPMPVKPGTRVTSVAKTRQILRGRRARYYANGTGTGALGEPIQVNVAAPALPPIVVKLDGRPVAALIGSTTAPAVRAAAMAIRAGRA